MQLRPGKYKHARCIDMAIQVIDTLPQKNGDVQVKVLYFHPEQPVGYYDRDPEWVTIKKTDLPYWETL